MIEKYEVVRDMFHVFDYRSGRKDEGRWFAIGYLLSSASGSPSASISAIERRGRNIVQPR